MNIKNIKEFKTITFKEFEEYYKLIVNPFSTELISSIKFLYDDKKKEQFYRILSTSTNQVWTFLEENQERYIAPGLHINILDTQKILGYFVTEHPHNHKKIKVKVNPLLFV